MDISTDIGRGQMISEWWITGICDGESTFGAYMRADPRYPNGRKHVQIYFGIALREDDRETIELIASYFDCGRIQLEPSNKSSNPCLRFKVSNRADLKKIVSHFRRYPLQSKKSKDFNLWAAIISEWCKKDFYRAYVERLCKLLRKVKEYPAT